MKKTLLVVALLALPMFSGAYIFGLGVDDEPMEIMYAKKNDPLNLNPTAGFATHRFPSISSTHIVRVRRVNAGDTVDVWDFQKGTNNYKLTSGGEWIDGSGETFYVYFWYDQTGNNNFVEQITNNRQPELLLNDNNGWPSLSYDGIDDSLVNDVGLSMNDYINADLAVLISCGMVTGSPDSSNEIYGLGALIEEGNGPIGIYRGIYPVGGDDRIWFLNDDGTKDAINTIYSVDEWDVIALDHQSNVLTGYKNGISIGNVSSGNTAFLGNALYLGRSSFGYTDGKQKNVLTFDVALTSANHKSISKYCKDH